LCLLLPACSPTKLLAYDIPQDGFTRQKDVAYAPGERHSLDIYRAKQPLPGRPVIVFFYGGEWKFGAKGQFAFVAEPLADRGITVVVADYGLYPPVTFPGFIEDSAAAVGWVHEHAAEIGGNPNNIFVMGHSAGAYNAVFLALDPVYLAKAGMQPKDLAGAIGISGPYNFLPITWPELKPIFEVVPDLNVTQPITYADGKNPPLLLMAGTADETVDPVKNTETLYKTVQEKGGPASETLYPGVGHIGAILAFAPTFNDKAPVVEDVVRFVTANTHLDR
jgi:acetyl esterase/lipase